MGIFNELGRRVESFKRDAMAAAEGDASHACGDCDARLHAPYDECPECGSAAVAPVDDPDED
ncbi:MAG: hypothetical protein ABEJ90_03195 [Halobacterium sp.]